MLVLLALVVILPMIGAMTAVACKRRLSTWCAVLFACATAVIGILAVLRTFPGTYLRLFGSMPWIGGPSIAETAEDARMAAPRLFGLFFDPLSALMLGLVTVMGAIITFYSTEYLSPRNKEHPVEDGSKRYFFWLLVFIGAMAGIAVSPNLLQMLIFWEITTLCSWVLISHSEDWIGLRAGYKALVMTHSGGMFYLVGVVCLFILTGSFEFNALSSLPGNLRTFVFFMFLLAAWAKAAQFPFHTWLPDAMAAPTPISAYLHAAAMVKAGIFLTARLAMANSSAISPTMGLVVGVMAMLTMAMAVLYYFLQDDLKKLLAYSTIAHLAYIFLGISLGMMGSALAFRGGMLHILTHGVAKTTLFLTVGAISYGVGTRRISDLGGLARKMPIETFAFFAGTFAITGLPPFACFWSKFYIFQGASMVSGVGPILMILAVVESAISFAWFLWVGHRVFFASAAQSGGATARLSSETEETEIGRPEEDTEPALVDPPAIHWVILVLAVSCVLVPLVGIPLVEKIVPIP